MSRTDDTTWGPRPGRSDNPEEAKEQQAHTGGSVSNHGPPARDDTAPARINRPPPSKLLSREETLQLTKNAVENGLQETKRSLAGSEAVGDVVRPKLTIDLGHKNIGWVPDEIVDIIKDEVARLSLSNNYIDQIPCRFQECIHLRYLNIRANNFTEFPKGVYNLSFLEILDVSRNKITKIPEEIRNLTSLRVLSVMQNLLEDLPSELSDMNKLQVLKVSGNSLRYPLKRIIDMKEADITTTEMTDNEKESALTAELKKYLKSRQPALLDIDSITDISDSAMETPKPPKRGNRFPVIPRSNGTESSQDSKSPSYSRPPPIPIRSHHRMASGQSSFGNSSMSRFRFPSASERNRSNSEGVIQGPGSLQNKRLGMVSRMNDLGTLDEVRPYRNSHLRGLSHGSLLRNQHSTTSNSSNCSSPGSPKERRRLREGFVRRMSSLPEYKIERKTKVPIMEAAKTLLYSLYQVHPHISALINVIRTEECRRTSLEIVFYNASTHIEQLNEALEVAEGANLQDVDTMKRLSEAVKHECDTCINAYIHVATQFRHNIAKILSLVDPKYVRSLLLMIYGSIAELRNVYVNLGINFKGKRQTGLMKQGISDTARKVPPINTCDRAVTPPTRERLQPLRRLRSETAIQQQNPVPILSNPSNPNANGFPGLTSQPWLSTTSMGTRSRSSSRSNTLLTSSGPSSLANTPRSGESFGTLPTSTISRINPNTGLDEYEEERIFEKIFVQLTAAYRAVLQAVPVASHQFLQCLELAESTKAPQPIHSLLNKLISRCRTCIDVAEALQIRLSTMKLKEPGGGMRNQREFWQLCKTFLQSFVELVIDMREAKNLRLLPPDIVAILRPVQKASREAGRLIDSSPWSYLAELNTSNPSTVLPPSMHPHHMQTYSSSTMGSGTTGSLSLTTGSSPQSSAMPATPLSAALGPAAQATVPSAPVSACSDRFFAGNLYERADSLLSMSGPVPLFVRR
ncbi:RAM signalling pathway protein domain-containing protein [Coccidioides immitis RS]|uniref:Cell morphogenesis protein Sog2 n=1 Tax=Coccidioides immitis (strain RS) TaxID=246410 RepID=J3KCQ9_COCIM|nr:RAM signalling pathway protein domain-containing protein [Coccidioides immitis RS]EAS33052.3 cell morphogenesis protein Sog2 [Coccidioides immitis RS]TPX19981.1 RAM signaling network component [Coccidioides immitis]